MSNDKKKIVIVGAGMAGLTAAAYLTRQNYNVLLLEKNDRYGGLLHTFDYDGFSFDSGPRAFINSGIVKPIFKDLGIDCDYLENKISIGIEDQMVRVNSLESLQEYKRIMLQLYPEKSADIEKIFSYMHKLSEHTKVLYEFDNPNFGDIMSDKKFVVKKLLPWTFKFLNALRNFNKFSMPMEKFMESLTDSQPIIDVLTQFFFRMTPTYFALGYFYVYLDYFYPRSGTIALPKLLAQKIQQGGGEIQLNTRVVAVDPSASTVTDAEGRQYSYDHLIWAADLKTLYRTVNPAGLDSKTAQSIAVETRRVLAAKGAESVFILFLGVDRPLSYFQARGGEHLFYTPSRKGLGETNQAARENLLQNFEQKSREEIFAWLDDFCRYNTFEVSIPALRDPDLAPEGKTGVMISCLFDYAMYEKIQKAGFYDEFKKTMEDKIINIFSETLYQGFADDVLFRFSATPLTIREAIGSSEGAITGWSFETTPPVVNKLTELAKSARTPIPGVLQAGQWAYAPAGVPIAMMTGWYAVQEIVKQSGK